MKNIINSLTNIFDNYETLALAVLGVIIFIILFLFKNKLSALIINVIGKIFFNKEDKLQKRNSLMQSLHKPIAMFFAILGAFLGLYINIKTNALIKSFKIATILIICWAIVNYLSNNLFLLFHFGEDADSKMNTTAIKFISNILKIVIIAFAVVMVISEFGYNINGLLTGIGVGGLAISLAAQDAVSNLISGFIIVFEKPFIVGDLIQTASIQGFVEDVTMRSTTIRTLEDTVVTVPNSKLVDDAIYNVSRMSKRLISFDIGLLYSTSNELMQKCCEDIKQYLIADEKILPSPIRVNFSEFEASSLNINITCYTSITDVNEYLEAYGNLRLVVKKIIEDNGAEFAFPSTTVYLDK